MKNTTTTGGGNVRPTAKNTPASVSTEVLSAASPAPSKARKSKKMARNIVEMDDETAALLSRMGGDNQKIISEAVRLKFNAGGHHDDIPIDDETRAICEPKEMTAFECRSALLQTSLNIMRPHEYYYFRRYAIKEFYTLPLKEKLVKELAEIEAYFAEHNEGEGWKKGGVA